MNKPKTQQELQLIIAEQDKHLKRLSKALVTLEQRLNHVTLMTQRARHENQRLREHVQSLERKLKVLNG